MAVNVEWSYPVFSDALVILSLGVVRKCVTQAVGRLTEDTPVIHHHHIHYMEM